MSAQFLVVLRVTRAEMLTLGPTEPEAKAINAHLSYWTSLADRGIALLFGRTQTHDADTMGLVILTADNLFDAALLANADPVLVAGVMTAMVVPYSIAGGALAPQTVH